MLTIKIIRDKLSDKYDRMNVKSNQNKVKYSYKVLYIRQIKGKCYTCSKHGHKSRYCVEIKNKHYTYFKNYGHAVEEFYNRKKYGQECTYCQKKGNKEKVFWKNKKTGNKNKRKRLMSLKRYITMSSSLEMAYSRAKIKKSTRKLSKCLLLIQDLRHIW